MRVDAVQTENFRLLQGGRCEFSPGVNVIAGANAQGKTTLLEAVIYAHRRQELPHVL